MSRAAPLRGDHPPAGGVVGGARDAAWRLLRAAAAGAHADRAASRVLAGLAPRDRALARELAYGTLRLRARLDAELDLRLRRPLPRTDPALLDWLRLGIYQLRETRIPDHAAVYETAEGARRTLGRRAVPLVNGVLRAAVREGVPAEAWPALEEDPARHLAVRGSHPEWLVRRWLDRWPLADVVRLVENDNRPPPVTFRALVPEEIEEALERAGLEAGPLAGWPGVYRLRAGDPARLVTRTPAVVQDAAASAVVEYAAPGARGPAYDACAAPGGKAVAFAFAAPAARPLLAGDVSRRRVARLRAARRRSGAPLTIVVADGRRPPLRQAGTVLLDVPCTGTGVLRRRPDARWRLDEDRLARLVRLQGELLDAAAGLLEPGGLLVYATCSLEPEENELQVESFLSRNPAFARDPLQPERLPPEAIDERGDLRVRPWVFRTDGAYACRLRRRAT